MTSPERGVRALASDGPAVSSNLGACRARTSTVWLSADDAAGTLSLWGCTFTLAQAPRAPALTALQTLTYQCAASGMQPAPAMLAGLSRLQDLNLTDAGIQNGGNASAVQAHG
jgi:hypothetical protein